MNIRAVVRFKLRAAATLAALAAGAASTCWASQPAFALRPALPSTPAAARARGAATFVGSTWNARFANRDRRGSWMAADAPRLSSLLYVADSTLNTVSVYSYPQGKLEGTLTGFNGAAGMCSNKAGDIFIINGNGFTVDVYAHGGTMPLRTLSLPGYPQLDCSVDPTSGDMALGTFDGSCGSCEGYIAVFKGGQGMPVLYQPVKQQGIPGCGYDDRGNLFCSAYEEFAPYPLFEVAKGSSTVTTLTFSGKSLRGGPIAWDGKYLALGSSALNTLYRIATNGSTAKVIGSTVLDGSGYYYQFWFPKGDDRVISPVSAGENLVGFWNYPAGGTATKTITGFMQPDGVTISTIGS